MNCSKYIPDSDSGDVAVFVGDSFLDYSEPYLSKNFNISMYVHRNDYPELKRNLVEEEHPNIVVFEVAERFITSSDYFMSVYINILGQQSLF